MTEANTSELRDPIPSAFSGDESGPMVLIGTLAVALAMIAVSGFFLSLLRNASPKVSIPAPRWGAPEAFMCLFGWFFLQVTASSFVLLLFPAVPPGEVSRILERFARAPLLTTGQILASSLAGLTIAGGILMLPRVFGQPLSVLGLGTGSLRRGALQGVLVWLCSLPGLLAITGLWAYALTSLGLDTDQQGIVSIFRESLTLGTYAPVITIAFLAVIVAPIVEELLFRVVVFRWLEHRFGVGIGIVGSGLLFGLIHGKFLSLLPISILGMLLAALFHRTGNLWSCIALHSAFNAGQLALMISQAI